MTSANRLRPDFSEFRPLGCKNCLEANPLDFQITMAFQPIVDLEKGRVFAHEALVRGVDGAGAGEVLSRVHADNVYSFDQTCRVKAIEKAAKLDSDAYISINFLPNAVYRPETCIRATLEAADYFEFPTSRIIFEVTEAEPVRDPGHLLEIFNSYRARGFVTAIDDFGSGYAGLNLLTRFRPDIIKLDMELCQNLDSSDDKRIITQGIVDTAKKLGIAVVGEGIETGSDLAILQEMGVDYFQGYLFAKPEVERFPEPNFPIAE